MKIISDKLSLSLITSLAHSLMYYVAKTLRLETINTEFYIEAKKRGENFIFAFWHNNFFIMPFIYNKYLPGAKISALTSRSRDGEYISRVLEKFNFCIVRGSSTRGGSEAIRLMAQELKNKKDIAITPDGPRGPRHEIQSGVITLSQISGCPIVPIGYTVEKKKVLHTWDKFVIPKPFSKGKLVLGDPIFIPKDANQHQKDALKNQLQNTLISFSEG